MKPLVSILCITYNHKDFIKQTIEGFLSQKTTFPFEIVIHDDASTDGTNDIIRQYTKAHPGLFRPMYETKNQYSQNKLQFIEDMFKQAKGKYIAICEGDDYWTDPEKLQKQIDFLENHPDYTICFHPTRVFYEDGSEHESVWPKLTKKSKLTTQELLRENFIPTNAVVYRKQEYDHIPTNVMPQDWYIHLYHAKFGKIGFIDKTMSAYRRHAAGVWSNSYRDTDKLWQKFGIAQVAMFTELLKLYGKNAEYKEQIHTSLGKVLNTLMEVDNRLGDNLLQRALNEYPEALGAFMNSQHQERELLLDKDHHIEELNKEIVSLREQLFTLKGELYQIRHTPGIGHLIKTKAFLGKVRRKLRHWHIRSQQEIREAFRRSLPLGTRRSLKHFYKSNLKPQSRVKTITAAIRPWPANTPLVSVVIPYYNRVETIDDTLASLAGQTFKNFETIIVDDGSTDEPSVKRLVELEHGDFPVRIIHQPNQGVAAARNAGVKQAKGKYIICLDSDDLLDPTFIEKCTITLEANPDASLVTTHQDMFGVTNEVYRKTSYDPAALYTDNMVITAAQFKREAWRVSGGYKPGIGYEDWEFWISLGENGFWGKLLPEPLFKYRTSMQSRYVDDKGEKHWNNIQAIRSLHPKYKVVVKKLLAKRQHIKHIADPKSALGNVDQASSYNLQSTAQPRVLITVPWMTFGGAETLIYNYCREIKDQFDISFITGLKSEHEWEYKFKEITQNVYHMANMFDEDSPLRLEFIANYIKTREIDILHIIHNGFTFDMLEELKRRFPRLKVVVTLFNDRTAYFDQSVQAQAHIDAFSTDNTAVAKHFKAELELSKHEHVVVIPNGINCFEEFSPKLFDRAQERTALGLREHDLAVVFVGRFSEEKNPDVLLEAARTILTTHKASKVKFLLIGDGPMRGELEKQIASIGSKNIIDLGYQPSAEVARYLSAADVFVLPSAIEGFPLSIIEAMAMGLAVVASRVGAIPDIIQEGQDGYIVTPGSPEDITAAITTLDQDRALLTAIKKHTRREAETKYSTIALGEHYRQLYREVME